VIRCLRMLKYARPQLVQLVSLLAVISGSVLLDALKPWPMKLILDSVIGRRELPKQVAWLHGLPGADSAAGLLGWLTGATVALFLAGWTLRLGQSYLETLAGAKMTYRVGAALFAHVQRLSLRFHRRASTGDLVKRILTDSGSIRDLVISVLIPLFTSLLSLAAMFVVMARLDFRLALLAIAVAPLLALCVRYCLGPMEARTYKQYELQGAIMSLAEQTLSALPVVRAYSREADEDERFAALHRESDRAYLDALRAQMKFKIGSSAVLAIGTAAVMLVGGYHVLTNQLSIGGMLVFLSYLTSLYAPMETLAYLSQSYASAAAGARRLADIFEEPDEVPEPSHLLIPGDRPVRGHIQFENVTYAYEPGRPVLCNIHFETTAGETIALVGKTGAGKSTLVSLIPRFFDPYAGRVLLDGHDLREFQLSDLRSRIGVVLQEPFLFPLTIAENIAYGRPGASRDQVAAAAEAAQADAFIQDLPDGYDTVLGERGATLSGGERQRLSIARALLKDAPVLILDEPTSALDAETEQAMLSAIERLIEGRTTFIIAHRLSTIRRADRIMVLDHGRVAESGSHHDLLNRGGIYARMVDLQSDASSLAAAETVA
jgi:ATP-binding cassette subfamily B protein